MGNARWLDTLDADQPVTEAAVSVVAMRLAEVQDRLAALADGGRDPVRDVHQLRVATRRADAALVAFRDWFRPKRLKRARRHLRAVRRAAAAARVADVQRERLQGLRKAAKKDEARRRGADAALAAIARDRRAADGPLAEVLAPGPVRALERAAARLVRKPRAAGDGPPPPLAAVAAEALHAAIDRIRRAATGDLARIENLHELRLRAKRVRYAIELFSTCFDASLREELYPEVKAIQDHLGEMNDAHELAERLERAARDSDGDEVADALRRLAGDEANRAESARRGFLHWWNDEGHRDRLLAALDHAVAAGRR